MNTFDSLVFSIQMVRATGFRYCIYKYLGAHGHFRDISDEEYLQKLCRYLYGKRIDFDNPKTFSEKLQWLKIFYHDPILTKMVDKYDVKQYVVDKIVEAVEKAGSNVIPTCSYAVKVLTE